MFEQWLAKLFTQKPRLDERLADRGENVAAKYLTNQGYRILERNFRRKVGEIDIVARDGRVLVFVEVKTRTEEIPAPELQVDDAKQHQITKAAKVYLTRFGMSQPAVRFDIIAVVWPPGREPMIRHTQHAFEATF